MPSTDQPPDAAAWVRDPVIGSIGRQKATRAARQPGFSRSDIDDIEQELMLHLIKKIVHYDPGRASRATFASRVFDNRVASLIRAVKAQKRAAQKTVLSLDQPIASDEGRIVALGETIEANSDQRRCGTNGALEAETADLQIDLRNITQDAPPLLRKLAALLSHIPLFAAGEVLGLSRRKTAVEFAKLRDLLETRGLCA